MIYKIKNNVVKNSLALFAIQFANIVVPLAIIPHLTRALGVDTYGTFAFLIAIATFACVITDFGFDLWGTAEVSNNFHDIGKIRRIFGAVTAAKILIMIPVQIILFIYLNCSDKSDQLKHSAYLISLVIVGTTLQPTWLINGLEKIKNIVPFILATRVVYGWMVVVFVNTSDDLQKLIIFYGLSQLFVAAISIHYLGKNSYKIMRVSFEEITDVIKKATPFFWSRLAVSGYTAGGSIFLGHFSTSRNVAMYSVAEILYRGAQGLLSPFAQVMYPYTVRTKNFKNLIHVTIFAGLTAFFGAFFTLLYSKEIVAIIFGDGYVESIQIIKIFMFAITINTVSVMIGYPALSALNKSNLANKSVVIAGLLQIAFLSFLYIFKIFEPSYVAMTVLLSEGVVLSLRYFWFKKELSLFNNYK
jgi:PST family polysaccharide transporter